MPTYEYRCKNCSHELEEFQSMKDEPLVMCPVCHTPNLVRLISNGAGLIFKGQGFYLTDYKKGASEATTSGPATAKPKTGNGSATDAPASTTTPPASKTESATDAKAAPTKSSGSPKGGSAPKSE